MARDNQDFDRAQGSMSKLYASETATFVTQNALRILGGDGYTREYPVERWHRDATIFTIFEGASTARRTASGGSLRRPP
jgi:alkylation response protein AidB-like acyl-CoA dehydrogenase